MKRVMKNGVHQTVKQREAVAVGQSLASRRFGPYEASLLLDLAGSDVCERNRAIETIVAAVAAGHRTIDEVVL